MIQPTSRSEMLQRSRSAMLQRTKSMFELPPDHTDKIVLGRCLLSSTAIALLSGYSSIATLCSAPAFRVLKDVSSGWSSPSSSNPASPSLSTYHIHSLTSDDNYWVICLGSVVLSLASWICLGLGRTSMKFWILGMVVQKLVGVGLVYFLYVDIGLGDSLTSSKKLNKGVRRGGSVDHDEDDDDHDDAPLKNKGGPLDGRRRNLDGGGIRFLEVHIKILEGRDLVPKDKNIWGRKVSSDPYVKIYHGLSRVGRTDICFKTLNPQWETSNQFQLRVLPQALDSFPTIDCQIWDHDHLSSDDSMGVCYVPVPTSLNRRETKWIPVQRGGKPGDDTYCRNATGALKVEVEVRSKLSRGFQNELCKTASQRGGFSLD